MATRIPLPLALLTILVLTPGSAESITIRPAISVGMGSTVLDSDFLDADPGLTLGGELLVGITPRLFAGAALDYSTFALSHRDDDLHQLDAGVSLRYFFPARPLRLFAAIVTGYSRQSFEEAPSSATADLGTGGGAGTWSANGFNLGAALGTEISLGPIALEVSAGAAFNKFGDMKNDEADQANPSETSGARLFGRIGIAVPLGAPTP